MKNFELINSDSQLQLHIDGEHMCNLLPIPKGSFLREDGISIHINSFYMSQFPVTQEFYKAVTSDNPSGFQGKQHPVEQVTWYDAVKFCNMLNNELKEVEPLINSELLKMINVSEGELDTFRLNPTSSGFRLPTEAEWEHAARGGASALRQGSVPLGSATTTKYAGSNTLNLVGWYEENNYEETKTVGLKFPNRFGLHDMSGNVLEWCWDWYGEYDKKKTDNPVGSEKGSFRVFRGGSWFNDAALCRSACRNYYEPGYRYDLLGFRLVFVP